MKIRWAMFGTMVGLFAAAYAADPSVTVHSVAQRAGTKSVDISYSATDADGDDLNVTISVKDGSTVVDSFSGSEGANQTVLWNAGAAWSNSVGSLTFHVVADDTKIPTNGLVAYYPFDGDAQDHSGNGNHGTVHGATLTTGISGQAYLFDGVDYIGLPNFNIFGGSEGWSYSVWINSSEVNNRSTVIDFHGDKKLLLDINNALLNARYKIRNATDVWRVLEYTISSSDWYSVVHTYSPTKGTELFVNGSSVGTDTVFGDGIDEESSAKNKIGQYFDGSFQFAGKIDQVRIYNRALSAAEISALYQSGQ